MNKFVDFTSQDMLPKWLAEPDVHAARFRDGTMVLLVVTVAVGAVIQLVRDHTDTLTDLATPALIFAVMMPVWLLMNYRY